MWKRFIIIFSIDISIERLPWGCDKVQENVAIGFGNPFSRNSALLFNRFLTVINRIGPVELLFPADRARNFLKLHDRQLTSCVFLFNFIKINSFYGEYLSLIVTFKDISPWTFLVKKRSHENNVERRKYEVRA